MTVLLSGVIAACGGQGTADQPGAGTGTQPGTVATPLAGASDTGSGTDSTQSELTLNVITDNPEQFIFPDPAVGEYGEETVIVADDVQIIHNSTP